MLKSRLSILGVILTSAIALSSCDNGDTTVAVDYSFDSTAMDVQSAVKKLVITITGDGKSTMTDYELERNPDSGALTSLTFKRVPVNGWSGDVDVKVDAVDSSGTVLMTASVKVHLSEHSAVAAMVKFKREAPADGGAAGSGGSSGSGGSASSGGASGSGGNAGSSGGSSGSGGAG